MLVKSAFFKKFDLCNSIIQKIRTWGKSDYRSKDGIMAKIGTAIAGVGSNIVCISSMNHWLHVFRNYACGFDKMNHNKSTEKIRKINKILNIFFDI